MGYFRAYDLTVIVREIGCRIYMHVLTYSCG